MMCAKVYVYENYDDYYCYFCYSVLAAVGSSLGLDCDV